MAYPINESFFDNIDNEYKAYMLGFLFADGNNNGRQIRLGLHIQDKEILDKFSWLIYNTNRVRIFPCATNLAYLTISNKHISEMLTSHGCIPNKTFNLKFPDHISTNLHFHFIRGFFDGDGSLSFSNRKDRPSRKYYFNITSTKDFLMDISSQFQTLGINTAFNKRWKLRDNNITSLRISGNKQIIKACAWMYSDANIYLKRKYDKYVDLLNYYKISS